MSTIYHIAKELGISASTVSRALSGKGYCSESVRQQVIRTAQELNYAPVHAAKMLKTKKTEKILFAVPDICNPFYFDMINGINRVLEQHGYLLILFYTKHSLKEELRAIQTLKEQYADGMIMVSFNFCKENIEAINQLEAPVVLTNKYETSSPDSYDRFDYVYVDTYAAVKEATEHLLDLGLEEIAYLGGSMGEQTGYERYCGYRDAITGAGLTLRPDYIFESDFTETGGYYGARHLLSLSERPRGIVAANDLMAIGAMQAAEEMDIRIPGELAVTGIDNLELSSRVKPGLTSVAMMQEEIGRHAATILMRRLQGRAVEERHVRLMPKLIVRGSTAAIPTWS